MTDYHFGQFTPDHLVKIKEGVELFNKEFFWECHEVLEDVWMEDTYDDVRYIYWAIIQVAASLHHVRDKNEIGARGMLSKAKEKLIQAEEKNVESDVVYKYLSWEKFKKTIRDIPSDSTNLDDYRELYHFKFSEFTC